MKAISSIVSNLSNRPMLKKMTPSSKLEALIISVLLMKILGLIIFNSGLADTISSKIAKTVFEAMLAGEGDAEKIIKTKGLKQVTDSGAIEAMVEAVIANNPEQVEQYRSGKEKVFGFFVGQIMKDSKGKANPTQVNQILKDKLSN